MLHERRKLNQKDPQARKGNKRNKKTKETKEKNTKGNKEIKVTHPLARACTPTDFSVSFMTPGSSEAILPSDCI